MSQERPPGVLGGLPHTRPHRRSDKRPAKPKAPRVARPAAVKPAPPPRASEPQATPEAARRPTAASPQAESPTRPLGTAVQAAAELAEIGLMASARALRRALSRLPRG